MLALRGSSKLIAQLLTHTNSSFVSILRLKSVLMYLGGDKSEDFVIFEMAPYPRIYVLKFIISKGIFDRGFKTLNGPYISSISFWRFFAI